MSLNSTAFLFEKRLPAFLVDLGIAGAIQALLMYLFVFAPAIQGAPLEFDKVIVWNFIITGISSIYIFLRDLFGGRSIGKRIMKLCVLSTVEGTQYPSPGRLVLRNILAILWPVEALLLLVGKTRLGDIIAKTKVVRKEEAPNQPLKPTP